MSKIRFITICHNLHNFGGHEYMYTKGIHDNLPKEYELEVWGREDVIAEVEASLDVEPIFSKVDYTQDMNFFMKAVKLIEREFKWYSEARRKLKAIDEKTDVNEKIVFFVHTFSIYNVWSWLFLRDYFRGANKQLFLFFRYSCVLLPRPLRPLFHLICSRYPKPTSNNFYYLTDTEELRVEFKENSGMELAVMPVVANTASQTLDTRHSSNNDVLTLTYLGSARADKGFQHLPSIIESVKLLDIGRPIRFCIQASIPGVDYLEGPCQEALTRLRDLQLNSGIEIELHFEHLPDDVYVKMLSTSDVLLLPYSGPTYQVQSSGILVEAMSFGVPCIAPVGTWMEKQLRITGGGVVFDAQIPGDVERSVCELLESFDKVNKSANSGAKLMQGRHGAAAQAAAVVAMINTTDR